VLGWLAGGATPTRRPPPLHVVLVDQSRELLALAEAALRTFAARALPGVPLTVETHPQGVEAYLAEEGGATFGLVGAAFSLNELKLLAPGRSSRRAQRFTDPVRRLTRPGGLMLAVEAGTRRGYLNLMAVRDQWRPRPILYPCPHGQDCPMFNARVTHWCHATVPLPRSFFFDEPLRERAGIDFRMRELNLGALAVQNLEGQAPGAPFRARSGQRAVSDPMPARGAPGRAAERPRIVLVCGPQGRLSEIPAGGLGPHPRGLWLEGGR